VEGKNLGLNIPVEGKNIHFLFSPFFSPSFFPLFYSHGKTFIPMGNFFSDLHWIKSKGKKKQGKKK
jgi:hypothetical protein